MCRMRIAVFSDVHGNLVVLDAAEYDGESAAVGCGRVDVAAALCTGWVA
jgi:hypothetical protein